MSCTRTDRSAPAIAIFVKTPGVSPVKTRLAERLGRGPAEEWHRLAAECVADTASRCTVPVYWAVAETEAMDHPLWSGLPRIDQGRGSLGRRMSRVHSVLIERHGGAILVGADLPQLRARHLRHALAWLAADEPRQVLGPAHDGGFWLYASNRAHAESRWDAVEYSRSDTARRFIAEMAGGGWEMLEPLTDLDVPEDLPAVLAELKAIPDPTGPQRQMVRWLQIRVERAA